MTRNDKETVSNLEDSSKTLKAKVDETTEYIKAEAGDARAKVQKSVDRGRRMVKEHPVAAMGAAIGATFVAGAAAGAIASARAQHKKDEKADISEDEDESVD